MNYHTSDSLGCAAPKPGMRILNTYRHFIDELHSGERWSYDYRPSEPQAGLAHNRDIYPLKMTDERALSAGIWWYADLEKTFKDGHDKQLVSDIIVHGSYGDFSTTHFSDVEITVFVDESVFIDLVQKHALSHWVKERLNKLIVTIDPTQHHGAFYIWERLLGEYTDLILPVDAYSSCWSITGRSIRFQTVLDSDSLALESLARLRRTLGRISAPEREFFRFGYNEYSVKQYLSNLMLVPALYYQSRGLSLSKRSSIGRFLSEFPGGFSDAIRLATDFRSAWPKPLKLLRVIRPHLVSTKIPQGKLDRLLLSVFSRPSLSDKFKSALLLPAKSAASDLLESVNENIQ